VGVAVAFWRVDSDPDVHRDMVLVLISGSSVGCSGFIVMRQLPLPDLAGLQEAQLAPLAATLSVGNLRSLS
jgi:hypothetical protein